MTDKIFLLPENIANQIAAGEVIQRPASAVKELMENAVDAGATEVRLVVQDAGKALVQVVDNGSGMSENDARKSFERHATSKIQTIDDLFHIRTMGFRGEALASIAAVAQVELRTKRPEDETGTCVEIENSVVKKQEPVALNAGTSIAMKNLFFNVPARRNFLKSNAAEMRHIVEEFTRVALAFPAISFYLTSNGQELFHLEAGSLKQRILQLLGNNYASRLVSVNEHTDYMNISGFVGKPETAKKTRGEQYFFVNNRFIRSAYLNHAVMNAFQEMIPAESFPMYILFIDLDPAELDVNVHPTKQEIKFEDEKIVYAFVQAAIRHALAQFSITPTLEFDLDSSIQQLPSIQQPFTEQRQSAAASGSLFKGFTEKHQAHFIEKDSRAELRSWKEFFEPQDAASQLSAESPSPGYGATPLINGEEKVFRVIGQLQNEYILADNGESLLIVHQQSAHERIVYEKLSALAAGSATPSQPSMFPATIHLNPSDAHLLTDLLPELATLGYRIEPFGVHAFILHGTPADLETGNEKGVIEQVIEQYKHFSADVKLKPREKLIRLLARQHSVRKGTRLSVEEMTGLLAALFACDQPNATPDGRPTWIDLKAAHLSGMFGR